MQLSLFFRSQGFVISYLYKIPWQKCLSKVGLLLEKLGTRSSTGIIWNQIQTISHSHCVNKTCSWLKWKVKIVCPLNSDWKDRSNWLADNNNLTSRAFLDSDFCQGVVYRNDIPIHWLVKMTYTVSPDFGFQLIKTFVLEVLIL